MAPENKIKQFFINMPCFKCNNLFTEDKIHLLRNESNYQVLKISCDCGKNIGIAIMGLGLDEITSNVEIDNDNMAAINSDDVLNAHQFICNLDKDWHKYLPNITFEQ